ncbi:helix-turn-helix domain-containing protein [Nocardia sp. MH4]|uniref:helix-turn-helix domain-containing protein n=1 Tax=Nocardia sp. MH4 TaxID=1768677 RepID=UPI001C4EA7B9|nr:helix-turn-helix transcriptional regulator [Nocardia sp. MH4]
MGMTVAEANRLIGSKLRGARAERDYSREELSQRSGVAVMTIRRAEEGSAAIKPTTLISLCRALELPVGELMDLIAEQIDQAGGLDPE